MLFPTCFIFNEVVLPLTLILHSPQDVTQDQEEQRRGKPKATYLTHAQVAEMIFSIANNDSNASPRLSQSPLNELDMELFRNMAKLLRGLYSRKDVDPDIA